MSLSSLNSIGHTVFDLESGNKNVDRRMDKRTKNGLTIKWNITNFERNLAMMVIYLPVKFEFDRMNRFRVRVRKRKMWTDRQTDVGHINAKNGYKAPTYKRDLQERRPCGSYGETHPKKQLTPF